MLFLVLLIVFNLVMWSSAFVVIGLLIETLSPLEIAFGRFFVASIFFISITIFSFEKRVIDISFISKKNVTLLFLAGFFGIFSYNILLNYGQKYVDPTTTSFIINTVPIITYIASIIIGIDRIEKNKIISILVCFVGIYFILFPQGDIPSFWEESTFLILGAALSQAIYFILVSFSVKTISSKKITIFSIWIGTVLLAIVSWDKIDMYQLEFKEILLITYLGVFPSAIAYLSWSYILKKLSASLAFMFLFFVPIFSLFLSWVFLSKVPPYFVYLGILFIVLGIILFYITSIKRYFFNKEIRG